eukprot:1119872-Pleurochrysis_carterae.AAC.1
MQDDMQLARIDRRAIINISNSTFKPLPLSHSLFNYVTQDGPDASQLGLSADGSNAKPLKKVQRALLTSVPTIKDLAAVRAGVSPILVKQHTKSRP